MTAAQVETWASNANAYVADEEEETFTARVSGELLLEELATVGVGDGGKGNRGGSFFWRSSPLWVCG